LSAVALVRHFDAIVAVSDLQDMLLFPKSAAHFLIVICGPLGYGLGCRVESPRDSNPKI